MTQNLHNICLQLQEPESETNKNFWAVNMHGDELKEEFIIPKGVRIIMFCYSGRKLDICPRFDKFIWREIFLNEDACYNYCTFLSNLVRYSSLRNHFCVYEAGMTIRNLVFTPDEWFRSGIYNLPVQAASYDPDTEEVYTSSSDIFDKVVARTEKIHRISVNTPLTAKIAKDKDSNTIIFTKQLEFPRITLSELVRKLSVQIGRENKVGFTLFLLTCRTGENRRGIAHPRTVYEELGKLYEEYVRNANLEKMQM